MMTDMSRDKEHTEVTPQCFQENRGEAGIAGVECVECKDRSPVSLRVSLYTHITLDL